MTARALLALALSKQAAACAVCFGKGADQAGFFHGLGLAIVAMIVTTMTMIIGIGATMYRIEKRRLAADRAAR